MWGGGRKAPALHSHSRVHLLFAGGVRVGRLDLPVAALQTIEEGGDRGQRHRVVLHSVAHVLGVQVLPLVRHDLGSLLAVQHREVGRHVDVDVIHGAFWQTAVGLGPGRGGSGPRVGAGAGAGGGARLAGGGTPGGAGTRDHGDRLHQAGAPRGSALLGLLLGPQASAAASRHQRPQDDEGDKYRANDKERHVDGHCNSKENFVTGVRDKPQQLRQKAPTPAKPTSPQHRSMGVSTKSCVYG